MELRHLGDSGLVVSVVGLGGNNLGRPGTAAESQAGARALVGAALDTGISLFDVADVYGAPRGRSEELLGAALSGRRDQAVIATKFGVDMHGGNGPDFGARGSRRYVKLAAEASLRRLDTDWIDLYQVHRLDPTTPLEETLAGLDDLVRAGTIRYAGLCNLAGPTRRRLAGPHRRVGPAGRRAEPVLPAGTGLRAGDPAGLPAFRAEPAAVLPAGQRVADRQVPARRRRASK